MFFMVDHDSFSLWKQKKPKKLSFPKTHDFNDTRFQCQDVMLPFVVNQIYSYLWVPMAFNIWRITVVSKKDTFKRNLN